MKRKTPTKTAPNIAPKSDAEPTREDTALVNDAYSDPTFVDPDRGDALDQPELLDDETALEDVPSESDGVQPLPEIRNEQFDDALPTSDDGHVVHHDDSETGMGAELHSVDELGQATVGAPRTHHRHRRK